ncbi:HIT-like protein [Leucogyrophana mollusca]|uniref:HIT-like protein n=1 Tax=Leucogyrophana mollusca TaxID=85980 RepID=A0ACB8BYB3_9AGAM|nr:HIT-like protein [Leucogyrophana mollusca]
MSTPLLFSTIEVTRQVFYRTSLSYAIVNLKPIVPGHVLVVPCRPVPRLADLTTPELTSLISSVQNVGRVIERVYSGDALTIACQDGKAAGQSIPHVHFHILPRRFQGDFFSGRNDDVYPALERAEGSLPRDFQSSGQGGSPGHEPLKVDADENRPPRTLEEMEKEATWLRNFFGPDNSGSAEFKN